jgi:archaellum biogenesis protein FlaJ (TadC family)
MDNVCIRFSLEGAEMSKEKLLDKLAIAMIMIPAFTFTGIILYLLYLIGGIWAILAIVGTGLLLWGIVWAIERISDRELFW